MLALFPALRRRGVVTEWREHTPGSFVVKLATISSMLEAPRRRGGRGLKPAVADPKALMALEGATLSLLRRLAVRSLEALGVRETEKFIDAEMLSQFNALAAVVTPGEGSEARLRQAISDTLDQMDE
jgi:hypothetical protein